MSGPAFSDSNVSSAVATGGIGDVNGDARGSGARYNAGKPPVDLIPLRFIADSFRNPMLSRNEVLPSVLAALYAVGEFQETHDPRALDAALRELAPWWETCALVFDYGREKYKAWNWAKGMAWSVPVACIGRHALAILRGESYDPESKQLHEGHILCNLVMLKHYADNYCEGNDLPPPELFKPAALPSTYDFVASLNQHAPPGAVVILPADQPDQRSVVIYGPMECGKTRYAKALAKFYGLTEIVDEWDGQPFPTYGALVLTNNRSRAESVASHAVAFSIAMIAAGLAVGS